MSSTGRIIYPTERFYGHADVLAQWVGLSGPRPIMAHLQHGWNHHVGFGNKYAAQSFGGSDETLHRWFRTLVWNRRNELNARSHGLENVAAVGAPFVYHDLMSQSSEPASPATAGTLVYPLHSGATSSGVERREQDFIDEIRARESRPVTVCLYWREFEIPEVHDMYLAAGFDVICHGRREDPTFLPRQYETILSFDRVVSNRVCTALFYGAYLGREVEVYGPVFGSGTAEYSQWFDAFQREHWPELIDGHLAGDEAQELGRRELGAVAVRPPDELARLLGWSGSKRLAGPVVAAAFELRRAAIAHTSSRRR